MDDDVAYASYVTIKLKKKNPFQILNNEKNTLLKKLIFHTCFENFFLRNT